MYTCLDSWQQYLYTLPNQKKRRNKELKLLELDVKPALDYGHVKNDKQLFKISRRRNWGTPAKDYTMQIHT